MMSARLLLMALLLLSVTTNCLLAGAIGFGITTRATASALVSQIKSTIGARNGQPCEIEQSNITCWGDSLTAGTGAGLREDYCTVLGNLLYRNSYNGGVGGETSSQIRGRMINRPAGLDDGITIIWAGRNNYGEANEIKNDIAAMVSSLPSEARFLVLGIICGDYSDEKPGKLGYSKIFNLNERTTQNLFRSLCRHTTPVSRFRTVAI